jgi:hypothetical protein
LDLATAKTQACLHRCRALGPSRATELVLVSPATHCRPGAPPCPAAAPAWESAEPEFSSSSELSDLSVLVNLNLNLWPADQSPEVAGRVNRRVWAGLVMVFIGKLGSAYFAYFWKGLQILHFLHIIMHIFHSRSTLHICHVYLHICHISVTA